MINILDFLNVIDDDLYVSIVFTRQTFSGYKKYLIDEMKKHYFEQYYVTSVYLYKHDLKVKVGTGVRFYD